MLFHLSYVIIDQLHISTVVSGTLGIPYYFEWDNPDQVDLSTIRHQSPYHFGSYFTQHTLILDEDMLALDEDEMKALKETFFLSEKAKKFAIAQKLLEKTDIMTWFFETLFVPMTAYWFLQNLAFKCNDVFNMLEKPAYVR